MPKLRKSAQEKREESLRIAIGRGKIAKGIKHDSELASAIGISPQTLCYQKRLHYENMHLCDFGVMARTLEFTPKELCDIFGIVYTEPKSGGDIHGK